MRFHPRVDLREGADRAGNGAGRDLLAGRDEPLLGAVEFGIGLRELQPEGDRLGMDAVRAADGRRQLVLEGASLQRGQQLVGIGDQDVGRARQLHATGRYRARPRRSCPDARNAPRGRRISARWVRKAMTSCLTSASMASMRATSNVAALALVADGFGGVFRDQARVRPSRRPHAIRSRTRCGIWFRATRWRPFPAGNSAGSWGNSWQGSWASPNTPQPLRQTPSGAVGGAFAAGGRR